MNTKLTLSVNEAVIEKAKKYASKNGKSVSKIVEEYLEELTYVPNTNFTTDTGTNISKEIRKFRGIIRIEDWEQNSKNDQRLEYLLEKYK